MLPTPVSGHVTTANRASTKTPQALPPASTATLATFPTRVLRAAAHAPPAPFKTSGAPKAATVAHLAALQVYRPPRHAQPASQATMRQDFLPAAQRARLACMPHWTPMARALLHAHPASLATMLPPALPRPAQRAHLASLLQRVLLHAQPASLATTRQPALPRPAQRAHLANLPHWALPHAHHASLATMRQPALLRPAKRAHLVSSPHRALPRAHHASLATTLQLISPTAQRANLEHSKTLQGLWIAKFAHLAALRVQRAPPIAQNVRPARLSQQKVNQSALTATRERTGRPVACLACNRFQRTYCICTSWFQNEREPACLNVVTTFAKPRHSISIKVH